MKHAEPFSDLVVSEQAAVRDAMAQISANGREIVLVQDGNGCIAGIVTDGDIRRGLLAGRTLKSPVAEIMMRDFFAVDPKAGRAAVLDLMKARNFQHVPVLDAERRLVAIHFLRDLIGAAPKPNIAVVMAGGKGTRLRPVTESIPKPMAEVAGRPMLERIVLHLVSHGIRTIYLAVNYKADIIEAHFGDGSRFGCRIEYLREDQPLGTGGPLSLLPTAPDHPLFVMNGDQVTSADLTAMLDSHIASGCLATIGIGPYQVQVPFGTVTENNGRLLTLEEKPTIGLLVSRGLYVVEPAALALVPKAQDFPITHLFEKLQAEKKPVGVFYFDDYWLDVGRPADLRNANGLG